MLNIRKIWEGLRIVPRASSSVDSKGELEVIESSGNLNYHNGSSASQVITASHSATLTNKTLTNPDITVSSNPIKLQETGGGTDKISVTAPSSIAAPYTFTLPPDGGTLDYVLRTNGSGATSWTPPTIDAIPTGTVFDFAGPEVSIPAGYLILAGQAISRSTYVNLFTLFGTTYGIGDGSTTFNLPDCRGRVTAGKDNMGGSAANRLTTAGSGIDGVTLGAYVDTQNHVLTSDELPLHAHSVGTLAITNAAITGAVTMNTSAVTGNTATDGSHVHSDAVASSTHIHTGASHTHGAGSYQADIFLGVSGSAALSLRETATAFTRTTYMGPFASSSDSTATPGGTYVSGTSGSASAVNTSTPSSTTSITSTGSTHSHSLTGTAAAQTQASHTFALTNSALTGSTGNGPGLADAVPIVQPTIIFNKIIKY